MLVEFLLIFIVACAASYALRKQIRAYPWTFYLFAIALDGVLFRQRRFHAAKGSPPAHLAPYAQRRVGRCHVRFGYVNRRIPAAKCPVAHIDLASTVADQGFKTKFCPSFLFGRPWAIPWTAVCISYSTNVCLIFLL